MPDWFYRTVAQRVLFRLPDTAARGLALGVIGSLGRSRLGRGVIELLGHMEAEPGLAFEKRGMRFGSPMGIGWRVDPEGRATEGLSCFGVGCIEILDMRDFGCRRGVDGELVDGVVEGGSGKGCMGEERLGLGGSLVLRRCFEEGREWVKLANGERLPVVGVGEDVGGATLEAGVVLQLGERIEGGGWKVGSGVSAEALACVVEWRRRLGDEALLIVSGGVAGPEDAVSLKAAGADVMLVDAGMVFGGPGLVKRCNEALCLGKRVEVEEVERESVFRRSWLWAAGLGVAVLLGGIAASVLAGTRVLLPYDEHFLGMSWRSLKEGLPLVFGFMAHDRGTLAGTMLGLGWFYVALAWSGIRRSAHGAKTAVVASALVGFASFFAFFGFGYFDSLHAFVAAVLFQLAVQVMVGKEGGAVERAGIMDTEDQAWRLGQWGQLLWIVHAVGLILAGVVILGIGMGAVFVAEDLAYLCMSREEALGLGERLVGVVAHDRATLGGMLLSSGVVSLLSLLWLYRRGARWLWWGMLGLGASAYVAAIGVHFWVGYLDARHLAPAFAGAVIWGLGLGLSWGYLKRS